MDDKSINNLEDVQYFLARISEFEKKYRLESWQFQFLYENRRKDLVGYNGRAAVDYSEWAFLYDKFYPQMKETLFESPPEMVNEMDQQKPEHRSGFCFSEGKHDQLSSTILRSCREPYLAQERRERSCRYYGSALASTQE